MQAGLGAVVWVNDWVSWPYLPWALKQEMNRKAGKCAFWFALLNPPSERIGLAVTKLSGDYTIHILLCGKSKEEGSSRVFVQLVVEERDKSIWPAHKG